jgi:hypothetical protein
MYKFIVSFIVVEKYSFLVHRGNTIPQDLEKVKGESEKITSFQDLTHIHPMAIAICSLQVSGN